MGGGVSLGGYRGWVEQERCDLDAVLRSNRGVSELTLRLVQRSASEWGCTLSLVGEHWDVGQGRPFTGTVDGFILTTTALDALHRHLLSWLSSPLDALVPSRLDAALELAAPGQTLCFRFGPVDHVLAAVGKPVVGIRFSMGELAGSFHLVCDPSCLALFADGLAHALQTIRA